MSSSHECSQVFFLSKRFMLPDSSCRTGALHFEVFHGQGKFPLAEKICANSGDENTLVPIPAASNSYREPLHLTRSGTCLPDIFCPNSFLVVSVQVYEKIKNINGVVGEKVKFDKLVNLPMPALGDMSYYEREHPYRNDPDPRNEYRYMRKLQIAPQDEPVYYHILPAIPRDIAGKFNDLKDVSLDFGRYAGAIANKLEMISKKLIDKYPIYLSDCFVFREDVFRLIAPFIDLDYFAIDLMPYNELP